MLRDNVGISELINLDKVPIPVDIHVARATLTTGVVKGNFVGRLGQLFKYTRKVWFASTEGLNLEARPMIALDVDEPLWHLSKYGCTKRNDISGFCPVRQRCEAKKYCVEGQIRIGNGLVELET
jgi:endonuclease III